MRIMFLGQHYAPEDVSGAILATELASDLITQAHQVSFITSAPSYPRGEVYRGYQNTFLSKQNISKVTVIRTWSYISPSKSFWPRILNYGTFSISAFLAGILAGRPEVILSFSPPLPLGISAWLLSKIWRVPWVLRVEDLYPDAAIQAGVLRNKAVIKFFYSLEKFLYQHATHISVISEGFKQNLISKGIDQSKLTVIPVWADPKAVVPGCKENAFRKEHELDGQFVVLYAGNMGHNSSLEDVLAAAELLKDNKKVKFVLVGEGVRKAELSHIAEEKNLSNVLFLPYQPRERYAEMMAAADMSLVTLNATSSWTSLPSKTFNIMSSQRPILAITPSQSEIAAIVRDTHCGINVLPGEPHQIVEAILSVKNNPSRLEEMGVNGRAYLIANYSREKCVDLYEAMLKQVLSKSVK